MHVENKRKYRTENRAKDSLLDEESMVFQSNAVNWIRGDFICMVMRSLHLIPNRPSHLEFNIEHAATRKLFLFFFQHRYYWRYINKGREGIFGHKWVIQLKELRVELTSNRLQHIKWRNLRRWGCWGGEINLGGLKVKKIESRRNKP